MTAPRTKPHLSQTALRAMLTYDPESGEFRWKERDDVRSQWNGRYAGKVAGYAQRARGAVYWSVRIYDWPFHAGPLAWLYMTGSWPTALVDHRDLDGLNNRWRNLRQATKSQNAANTGPRRRNTTGFKGVSLCKKTGRYRANIALEGKQTHLGTFDEPEAAHQAYIAAAKAKSGDFARWSR